MIPRVEVRVLAHKTSALSAAPSILQKHMQGGLLEMGKKIQASARIYMRKDTGAQQKDLSYRVTVAGMNMNLIVFSTLVQAFVDAYGLKRRKAFPPFGVNSRLYDWVRRRVTLGQLQSARRTKEELEKGEKTKRKKQVAKRRPKKIKRLKGIHVQTTLKTSERNKAKGSDLRRLSFLVARAIFRHGITAGGWTTKTLLANRTVIMYELTTAIHNAAVEIRRA